jgi:hypothetical protein
VFTPKERCVLYVVTDEAEAAKIWYHIGGKN